MYSIEITSRAERELKKLARDIKNRIVPAIQALANDPRPEGCLQVKSEPGVWRVRVGDYRIGYIIDDGSRIVTIIRIANRREFYD